MEHVALQLVRLFQLYKEIARQEVNNSKSMFYAMSWSVIYKKRTIVTIEFSEGSLPLHMLVNKEKTATVAWQQLCLSIKEGGLGDKSLPKLNQAAILTLS